MSSDVVFRPVASWRRSALAGCLLAGCWAMAPLAAQSVPVTGGEAEEEAPRTEPATPGAAVPGGQEAPAEPADAAGDEGASAPLGERGFVAAELMTGGGRDDSRGVARPEGANDLYLARASLLLYERPSSLSAFTLAYEPEIERLADGDQDPSVNHSIGLLLERETTRDFSWLVGGSLLDGDDPSRYLGGLQIVLPVTPYRQTRAFASFERRFELSSVSLGLGWGSTEIEAVPGVLREVDQSEVSGQLGLSREIGARSSVGLGYAYVRPDAEGPFLPLLPDDGDDDDPPPPPGEGEEPPSDDDGTDVLPLGLAPTPIHAVTAAYRFRAREDLELQLAGGVARDGYDRTTPIGSLELVERGAAGSLRIKLDHSLVALGTQHSATDPTSAEPIGSSGLLSDSEETALTVGIRRKLAQWLWWEQLLWGAQTSIGDDETIESLAATTRLVFRTPWRVGFFAEADWFDQRAGSGADGSSRLRWAIGLRADAGGPPGTRGYEIQRERMLRVLPDRGGE